MQTVTIIRHISQIRVVKDSELLYALEIPVEWNVSRCRKTGPESSGDIPYRTDLRPGGIFFVETYAISRNKDQAYRDRFLQGDPAPAETTVTIHGITMDRFETRAGNRTNISYGVRKDSANERGYASVISFSSENSDRFGLEDFEKVAALFRYFPGSLSEQTPGEEIFGLTCPSDTAAGRQSSRASGDSRRQPGGSGCSRCST